MSRWHDRSPAGVATWANLSLEERLADRLSDMLLAAQEIQELLASAPDRSDLADLSEVMQRTHGDASAILRRLPAPRDIPERNPELADVLDRINRALEEISGVRGQEHDVMLGWVEQLAASEVLSLFYEIQRLDALLGHSSAEHAW